MYLFSRSAVLIGSPRQVGGWVDEVTARARDVSGMPITAWAAWFGRPVGTHVWTVPVEGHGAVEATSRALLGDDVAVNPSGGPLVANPVMATGLIRIGEVADRIRGGTAARGVAHAAQGPCLQQNLVCVLEGDR